MRKIISLLFAIFATALAAPAQEAIIKRVEAVPFEVIPALQQRKDLNGEPCALVHVEVIADDVKFEGNVIGEVEHGSGEYRVYLSPGTKMMRIKSGSFLPVFITFPDYGIKGVLPNAVYVVTLSLPQAPAQPQSASAGRNYLMLKVEPASATVTVDGKPREVRDGMAKMLLPYGTYPYRVEATGYLPQEGTVTIGSERAERTVTLRSTKGSLEVRTATPGTEIYINGERMGAGSWRGDLLPDTYSVEGRLASHRSAEQLVAVETGESKIVNIPELIPITGSLNVDYEPAGAAITIDGTAHGTTPAIIDNLLVGPRAVTISADGYNPATLTATVTEGQLTELAGTLSPKPAGTLSPKPVATQPVSSAPVYEQVNYERFQDPSTKKWGYKDETGKIVIPAKFDWSGNFHDGLGCVELNGKYGYIDKTGQLVIPAKFDRTLEFSEGLAAMKINFNDKWGFIDKTGQFVIPAKFDGSGNFLEGLAPVQLNGKWGFIDKTGQFVIPAKFDFAWCFSEGLAPVQLNGKYGYIDKTVQLVIPAKFDYARSFSEGLAMVYLNGKKGYIDKTGQLVIPAQFDDARDFLEGLAPVKFNGKWGYIDKTGQLVIPAQFDLIWDFSNGKAKVKLNGREFYIDRQGNEVK